MWESGVALGPQQLHTNSAARSTRSSSEFPAYLLMNVNLDMFLSSTQAQNLNMFQLALNKKHSYIGSLGFLTRVCLDRWFQWITSESHRSFPNPPRTVVQRSTGWRTRKLIDLPQPAGHEAWRRVSWCTHVVCICMYEWISHRSAQPTLYPLGLTHICVPTQHPLNTSGKLSLQTWAQADTFHTGSWALIIWIIPPVLGIAGPATVFVGWPLKLGPLQSTRLRCAHP